MNGNGCPDSKTRVAELERVVPLNTYMARLSTVMMTFSRQFSMVASSRILFEDYDRAFTLVKLSRDASALGKELLAAVSAKDPAPREMVLPLVLKETHTVARHTQKEKGTSVPQVRSLQRQ